MYNQPNQGGFCPKCGRAYAQGAAFCQGCGTNLAPQPQYAPPQPQYAPPQPQYVQPQPQYVAPQPQNVAPQPAPQPQYVAPAPAPAPAPAAPAIQEKRPLWKLLGSIFLLVAILLMAIVPISGFITYDYDFPSDPEYKEYEKEAKEDIESYGVFEVMFGEDFSIINAFEDFVDEMDTVESRATRYEYNYYYGYTTTYVDEELVFQYTLEAIFSLSIKIIIFVGTLIFLIATQIFAIKAIIAFCKKEYGTLSSLAFATLGKFASAYVLFSIFTYGGYLYLEDTDVLRYGISMAPAAIVALVLALCLIVATAVVSTILNKKALAPQNRANYFKSVAAFVGSLVLVVIALSQKAQPVFNFVVNSFFYFEDDSDRVIAFIFALGMLILYATVAKKLVKELSETGLEVTYFSHENDADIVASKVQRPSAPNLIANGIFLVLIAIANYVIDGIYDGECLLIDPTKLIIMTVLAIGIYVAYKVLGSVLKPKPQPAYVAPQQQYAPQPVYAAPVFEQPAPVFEQTAPAAEAPVFEQTAPVAEAPAFEDVTPEAPIEE